MENPIKMDDLDWFGGTTIFGNTHMDMDYNPFKEVVSPVNKLQTNLLTIVAYFQGHRNRRLTKINGIFWFRPSWRIIPFSKWLITPI